MVETHGVPQGTEHIKRHVYVVGSQELACLDHRGFFGQDVKVGAQIVPGEDRASALDYRGEEVQELFCILLSHTVGRLVLGIPAMPEQ